jgi:hypothetical protein
MAEEKKDHHPHEFHIQIDRAHFIVHKKVLTGQELRNLPQPPVGPERDLFKVVPGSSDLKIEFDTQVEMHDGERFFTAPAVINPGSRID